MIQKELMFARKLSSGIIAAAATSVMILGANAPAQATTTPEASSAVTTHSDNRYAPSETTALPQCTTREFMWAKTGGAYTLQPSMPGGNSDCILQTGNSNLGVNALQSTLVGCHGKTLAIDGIFGAATGQALRDVQRIIGVTVDGVYGPATRKKMSWSNSNGGCRPGSEYYGF